MYVNHYPVQGGALLFPSQMPGLKVLLLTMKQNHICNSVEAASAYQSTLKIKGFPKKRILLKNTGNKKKVESENIRILAPNQEIKDAIKPASRLNTTKLLNIL